MRRAAGLVIIGALLTPVAAIAQAEPKPASEHRLSPEQIEAVLTEAAKKRQAAEARDRAETLEGKSPRQIHGEVGVSIGTGGYREVLGTAIYPMEDGGAAAISFDFVDLGRRRVKR